MQARKEGRTADTAPTFSKKENGKSKIKVKPLRWSGARVFVSKHLREITRESIFGIISIQGLISVALTFVIIAIFKGTSGTEEIPMSTDLMLINSAYMPLMASLLFTQTSSGIKELTRPYIYMIPERAVSKLWFSNMDTAIRGLLDGIIVFGIVGAVMGASFPVIALLALAFGFQSMVVISLNFASLRFMKTDLSKAGTNMMFAIVILVMLLPGIICGVIAGSVIGEPVGLIVGLLVYIAWLVIVSLSCFAISQGIIHDCDARLGERE